ncbi:hypothetical protein OZX62_00550 [Bifidobacterium sp. ESL0690]|uniref:hypothetical protein n=1 Tax=Bifidobacterium sp. ESL0690 TaxID=2983214 RepID=UPI0023F85645|nr:hypothetical protein [Bifidobacterium sp. ESL0690]WEV46833.1 hypothetical protein OZX62_00550 [Bifidobacterium sp. ESL0690]
MKEDSDQRSNQTGVSRPQDRNGSHPGNAHEYNVNELRRQSPESQRKARRRKSFIISAIVVIFVVILIVAALLISLKTLKRNTSPANGNATTTAVQGKTKAPEGDANQMKQGIEQVAGTCSSGWMDIDLSSELPGASAASFCGSTQVAFITFQTKAAASMDGDMVRSQAPNLISQYAGSKVDEKDLRVLSSGLWMAAGKTDAMKALQQQWGGKLEELGSGNSGE